PHLPTHDIGPLIDEERKIAIGLNPLGITRADDRFRCWPNNKRLTQRAARLHFSVGTDLKSAVRNNGAFLGETFDVLGFFREIAQRDEEREIRVAVAGRAKHRVELTLDIFSDAVTLGA